MFHYKTIVGRGFCDIQNNQGRGKGYYTLKEKKWKSCFCFFTDEKQQKAREFGMIIRDLEWP